MKLLFPFSLAIAFVALPCWPLAGLLVIPQIMSSVSLQPRHRLRPRLIFAARLPSRNFSARNTSAKAVLFIGRATEEIGFYEFHRWAMNPGEMITQFVADSIRSQALIQDRYASKNWYRACVRAEGQYRAVGGSRPRQRRSRSVYHLGRTAGHARPNPLSGVTLLRRRSRCKIETSPGSSVASPLRSG